MGETLPGLLRAQDVSHFHGIAGIIKNIDEANAKKQEFEEAQKQKAAASEQVTGDGVPEAAASTAEAPEVSEGTKPTEKKTETKIGPQT
jgi:hypothetical protein